MTRESSDESSNESTDPVAEQGRPPRPSHPADESPWQRFFRRGRGVLLRPAGFWKELAAEEATIAEAIWPHAVILIAARATFGLLGMLFRGEGFGSALGTFATSLVSWFALIWAFGVAVGVVARTHGGKTVGRATVVYSAYTLTPLFVVGMLAAIPVPYLAPVAELIAIPYALYVLSVGVVPLLVVPLDKAPATVGMLCGSLLALWSIIPVALAFVAEILFGGGGSPPPPTPG